MNWTWGDSEDWKDWVEEVDEENDCWNAEVRTWTAFATFGSSIAGFALRPRELNDGDDG